MQKFQAAIPLDHLLALMVSFIEPVAGGKHVLLLDLKPCPDGFVSAARPVNLRLAVRAQVRLGVHSRAARERDGHHSASSCTYLLCRIYRWRANQRSAEIGYVSTSDQGCSFHT